jgi:hypothetical protein
MCAEVCVCGTWVDTTTKLREALKARGGSGDLIRDPAYETMAPDSCLCCVDIPATLEKASREIERRPWWHGIPADGQWHFGVKLVEVEED